MQINETIKLLHERASLRNFSDKKIEQEILDNILEAGLHAASGGNLQPYSIIKIEENETSQKLAEMCGQKFISMAPVNLVFCLDFYRNKQLAKTGVGPYSADSSFRHFWIAFQDTIISAQSICVAADSYGLGSCYVGSIIEYPGELSQMFNLPKGVYPVVLLSLGYPKIKPPIKSKFNQKIMVHDEKYVETPTQELYNAYLEREKKKVEIDDNNLEKLVSVCEKVHGKKLAEECKKEVEEKGYINPIQYRFGLHYRADNMPKGNLNFIKSFEDRGLNFFKKWELEND